MYIPDKEQLDRVFKVVCPDSGKTGPDFVCPSQVWQGSGKTYAIYNRGTNALVFFEYYKEIWRHIQFSEIENAYAVTWWMANAIYELEVKNKKAIDDRKLLKMKYYGIKRPDGLISWVSDSTQGAWNLFFRNFPNRPAMYEAIKAYAAIGYKCVELEIKEK